MTTFVGWEVEVEMPVFTQETQVGDGVLTEFTMTKGLPLVDITGDGLIDENDVKVYVDEVAQTVTSVVAGTGVVTLSEAPASDASIDFRYAYGPAKAARSQSVSIETSKSKEEVPILGETEPFLKSGRRTITGSLESLITGRQFFEAIGADQTFTPKFKMTLNIGDPPAKIELSGVVVETWSPEFPRDDLATQTIDFGATSIRWL